jgi:type VI secretion system protein VasG
MSQTARPAALDRAERELANARLERATLQKDREAGILDSDEPVAACDAAIEVLTKEITALGEKWQKEKAAADRVIAAQRRCAELGEAGAAKAEVDNAAVALEAATRDLQAIQGDQPMVFPYVSAQVCGQVISDWTGIPIGSMIKDEAAMLLALEDRLRQRIAGQDDALAAVAGAVRASKAGMGNPDAPLGVFLFVGPSGVGKTECALALADLLFGGSSFTTVINMSEYREQHTVSQLKGAPPGYVGYGEGGILTEAVRQKPYSIVILDEVEKAHIEVMNLFYQVFDKGFMRDGEGREINFRNTVIVMTSNLASEHIVDLCTAEGGTSTEEIIEAIRPTLSAHFRPALLARCAVVPFWPLGADTMRNVVRMKLDRIASRVGRTHGITMSYGDGLVEGIASQCTTIESGARNADAVISQVLLPAISRRLLAAMGEGTEYSSLRIGAGENGELTVEFA